MQLATGTGVTPRILLSKTLVDFGTKIVIRSNQIKAPYVADLYITNHGASCKRSRRHMCASNTCHMRCAPRCVLL